MRTGLFSGYPSTAALRQRSKHQYLSFNSLHHWRCTFNKLASNFNRLSLPAFLAQAQRIVTSMTGNASFPEPWPAPVPSLVQITTDLNNFANAFSGTASGDRTRVSERNAARSMLSADLQHLAFYLQIAANGNDTLLATTGFNVRMPVPHSIVTEPPAPPEKVLLSRGPASGLMLVQIQRVPKASAYDLQIASADPTVETNWSDVGTYTRCRRIEVPDLAVMKTYSVRVRAINGAGPGVWTAPASLVVL